MHMLCVNMVFLNKFKIVYKNLGPVAKFRCTAWLGEPWVAGRRRRARDFAGKILE